MDEKFLSVGYVQDHGKTAHSSRFFFSVVRLGIWSIARGETWVGRWPADSESSPGGFQLVMGVSKNAGWFYGKSHPSKWMMTFWVALAIFGNHQMRKSAFRRLWLLWFSFRESEPHWHIHRLRQIFCTKADGAVGINPPSSCVCQSNQPFEYLGHSKSPWVWFSSQEPQPPNHQILWNVFGYSSPKKEIFNATDPLVIWHSYGKPITISIRCKSSVNGWMVTIKSGVVYYCNYYNSTIIKQLLHYDYSIPGS